MNNGSKKAGKTKFTNSKTKDSSSKIIFGDPVLCSQFLRGYTEIEMLKDVQPEDIEDVTERYVHMFTEERESDIVKKVHIKNSEIPFYLISLIEHKSKVDYNVVMQILRYMVFIWEDYERSMEKQKRGISKTKAFKYPPVLPIVYYDGADNWTAALELKERVYLSDVLKEYVPDFKCLLIQLNNYSNKELMQREDELSVIMMVNKLHEAAEFPLLEEEVSSEYLKKVGQKSPEYLLEIIARVVEILLLKIEVPREEVELFTGQIKEREMGELFANFKEYSVTETRKRLRAELQVEVRQEVKEQVREEVKEQVREEVKEQVREEVKEQVREEVKEQVREEVKEQVREEIKAQMRETVNGEMKAEKIATAIDVIKEFHASKETAVKMVKEKFDLSDVEASDAVERYW